MRKTAGIIFAAVIAAAVLCLAGCSEKKTSEVSPEAARKLMETYLVEKGFADEDFLAEDNVMVIDGVKVYVFAWRTKAGENADRLFGMYAVSADGKTFYEYQSARDEWIKDMNS